MESMESMMMKSVRWMVVAGGVGVALLLVMPSPRALEDPAVADPASVGMSAKRLQRLDAFIQEYIDTDQIAGAVTLVARNGKVVHFEAQGWRDKGNDVPMTRDTIFNLMSMTKPVVSTALMLLFEEGRFLLDDPIAKWLPEYADHQVRVAIDETHSHLVPEARPVTVRHVLTHTSGLTLNPNRQGLSEEQLTAVTNQGKGWPTLAEQVAHAAVIPAAFPPRRRVAVRGFDRLRGGARGEDLGAVAWRLPARASLHGARHGRHHLSRASREDLSGGRWSISQMATVGSPRRRPRCIKSARGCSEGWPGCSQPLPTTIGSRR